MFERFTDRARRVVVLAQQEALGLNHNYIGSEHLLLGLIVEGEGVAASVLTSSGLTADGVRRQVVEVIGRGPHVVTVRPPFTPRAKKVLELSLSEALMLSHNYIGTEHLLLGLIREGEGVGAQLLVRHGASLAQTRQRVLELLRGPAPAPAPRPAVSAPAPETPSSPDERRTRVFVSYRRKHDSHVAGRIADWLDVHLGQNEVFMDVDSITLGVDFVAAINEAVASCDVLLAVIGSDWATMRDARG